MSKHNSADLVPIDECEICGKPEEDHHDFIARKKPRGCVCDWKTWGKTPYPVCDQFIYVDDYDYCDNCGHGEQCHINKEAREKRALNVRLP